MTTDAEAQNTSPGESVTTGRIASRTRSKTKNDKLTASATQSQLKLPTTNISRAERRAERRAGTKNGASRTDPRNSSGGKDTCVPDALFRISQELEFKHSLDYFRRKLSPNGDWVSNEDWIAFANSHGMEVNHLRNGESKS